MSPNGENVGDVTRTKVDGKVVSITIDHDPSTIHVGGYVVTLTEIGHVEKVVSNLDQGYEGQYNQAIVGHRYSEGLDKGHSRFLGYFTNFASGFTTGPNINGYSLDRVEAQIQMGLTKIIGLQPSIAISYTVTFSRARLLVTEGDSSGSTYTVRLGAEPTEDVVVSITGQSGTDLTVSPTSLTFTTANWDQAQTVTVTAAADSDNVNDDVTLVHIPTGGQFLAASDLAVRVDDDEDSDTAELPDAPTSSIQLPARPAPILGPTARRTNATPVISLFGDHNLPYPRLCSFRSNAAYTSRLYSPGPADTDVIYAGDCADVTLRPNTKYFIVFENYPEIPRTSVYADDDFYYVARAQNVNEDAGAAAGWSIRDEAIFDRYIVTDHQPWKRQLSSLPAMLAVYASPTPPVSDGRHGDWHLSTSTSGFSGVRWVLSVAAPSMGPILTGQYVFSVVCFLSDSSVRISLSSSTDTDWPPHGATLELDIGTNHGDSDLYDGSAVRMTVAGEDAQLSNAAAAEIINALVRHAPNGKASLTVTLLDSNDMATGTRTLLMRLNGAELTIPAVQHTCGVTQSQQAALDSPEETEAEDLALQSATVDGSTLTLTYNGTLDVGATPSKTAFTVNVNSSERNIFIVGLGGSNVLLTLSPAVESGDTVTVGYAKPDGSNVIKDTDGNEADSFTAQAVTNNTAAPVTEKSDPVQAPGSLNVARHESGKLRASWTAPTSGPTPTGYTAQWKESGDDWATAADVSEANVKGASHVITGLTDGTAYSVRVMARDDDDDSDPSAEVTATPQETVAPTPSSAAVDGATLTITFSEALDTAEVPDKPAFAVSVARSSRGVDTVSLSGSAVTLTLASAVSSGEAVTVDYTAPSDESAARLQDLVGNAAASFTGQAVTNNTAPAAPLTPPNSQATGNRRSPARPRLGRP